MLVAAVPLPAIMDPMLGKIKNTYTINQLLVMSMYNETNYMRSNCLLIR